jgi:hypothetical protein
MPGWWGLGAARLPAAGRPRRRACRRRGWSRGALRVALGRVAAGTEEPSGRPHRPAPRRARPPSRGAPPAGWALLARPRAERLRPAETTPRAACRLGRFLRRRGRSRPGRAALPPPPSRRDACPQVSTERRAPHAVRGLWLGIALPPGPPPAPRRGPRAAGGRSPPSCRGARSTASRVPFIPSSPPVETRWATFRPHPGRFLGAGSRRRRRAPGCRRLRVSRRSSPRLPGGGSALRRRRRRSSRAGWRARPAILGGLVLSPSLSLRPGRIPALVAGR